MKGCLCNLLSELCSTQRKITRQWIKACPWEMETFSPGSMRSVTTTVSTTNCRKSRCHEDDKGTVLLYRVLLFWAVYVVVYDCVKFRCHEDDQVQFCCTERSMRYVTVCRCLRLVHKVSLSWRCSGSVLWYYALRCVACKCFVLYCIARIVSHCLVPYRTIVYCIALHCTALRCIALRCVVLYWIVGIFSLLDEI